MKTYQLYRISITFAAIRALIIVTPEFVNISRIQNAANDIGSVSSNRVPSGDVSKFQGNAYWLRYRSGLPETTGQRLGTPSGNVIRAGEFCVIFRVASENAIEPNPGRGFPLPIIAIKRSVVGKTCFRG